MIIRELELLLLIGIPQLRNSPPYKEFFIEICFITILQFKSYILLINYIVYFCSFIFKIDLSSSWSDSFKASLLFSWSNFSVLFISRVVSGEIS